jgi:hypothetical protein
LCLHLWKEVVLEQTHFTNIPGIVATKIVTKNKSNVSEREKKIQYIVFNAFVYLISIMVGCIIHNGITQYSVGPVLKN